MDLTGRYLKVLNDRNKQHYPCIKGDYMLFRGYFGSRAECWGETGKRSNYWGKDVHKNPDFELMPKGFNPDNISYEIY
jgi:hypothetical protein